MLKRKTPLKAKKYWNPKRKPLRRVSKKRAVQNKQYSDLKKEWHAKPENRHCRPCKELWNILTPSEPYPHHMKSRHGKFLTDTKWFLPICAEHHTWIHSNPSLAYSHGYLIKN